MRNHIKKYIFKNFIYIHFAFLLLSSLLWLLDENYGHGRIIVEKIASSSPNVLDVQDVLDQLYTNIYLFLLYSAITCVILIICSLRNNHTFNPRKIRYSRKVIIIKAIIVFVVFIYFVLLFILWLNWMIDEKYGYHHDILWYIESLPDYSIVLLHDMYYEIYCCHICYAIFSVLIVACVKYLVKLKGGQEPDNVQNN